MRGRGSPQEVDEAPADEVALFARRGDDAVEVGTPGDSFV
jgi:hypothetical protein